MRRFLVSAAIVGLITGFPPAFAQDREHHDQAGPPQGEQRGGGQPHGGAPQGGPGPRPAAQANPEPRGGPEHAFGRQNGGAQPARPANEPSNANRGNFQARPNEPTNTNRGNFQARPGEPTNTNRGNFQARPGEPTNTNRGNFQARPNEPSNAMRGPQGRPGPNDAMRGPGDGHRDFSNFRNYHQNFRAERRFHAPGYRPPQGYYARRWAWGMTLPPLFWGRQYWLMDYAIYDLPPPPFGTIWVRVGDDALLIDQTDGMIITVAYGVFY